MNQRILEKISISSCLLVAVYLTLACQCDGTLLSCKKYIFYALVAIPLLYIVAVNM